MVRFLAQTRAGPREVHQRHAGAGRVEVGEHQRDAMVVGEPGVVEHRAREKPHVKINRVPLRAGLDFQLHVHLPLERVLRLEGDAEAVADPTESSSSVKSSPCSEACSGDHATLRRKTFGDLLR